MTTRITHLVHAAVATSPEMLRIILKNGGDPNLHSDLKYSHTDEYDLFLYYYWRVFSLDVCREY
jgi:hypothetical protein